MATWMREWVSSPVHWARLTWSLEANGQVQCLEIKSRALARDKSHPALAMWTKDANFSENSGCNYLE